MTESNSNDEPGLLYIAVELFSPVRAGMACGTAPRQRVVTGTPTATPGPPAPTWPQGQPLYSWTRRTTMHC